MPMNYFTMWGMLTLMAFGAVGGALVHGNVLGSIRDAYPSDSTQRYALQRCGEMDSAFSRFSAGDREACYRAVLPATAHASSNGPAKW
ncbi:MAG TPA: hypothetical protein VN808_17545 [Stellaceae bacterium]|nr:hypothetical protein [Stellaceae bacterium]